MEGRCTKLVVIATTLALVLAMANADNSDFLSGFNFCNLNGNSLNACSKPVNNNPTPECCAAVKGVDPKCVCMLVTSIGNNREEAKKIMGQCGINAANC